MSANVFVIERLNYTCRYLPVSFFFTIHSLKENSKNQDILFQSRSVFSVCSFQLFIITLYF